MLYLVHGGGGLAVSYLLEAVGAAVPLGQGAFFILGEDLFGLSFFISKFRGACYNFMGATFNIFKNLGLRKFGLALPPYCFGENMALHHSA